MGNSVGRPVRSGCSLPRLRRILAVELLFRKSLFAIQQPMRCFEGCCAIPLCDRLRPRRECIERHCKGKYGQLGIRFLRLRLAVTLNHSSPGRLLMDSAVAQLWQNYRARCGFIGVLSASDSSLSG